MHDHILPEGSNDIRPSAVASYLTAVLGFLTVLIDGFDTQSVAFAGPFLKHDFGGGGGALGLIFGCGMTGGLIGAFILGPLGDKFGRRPLIIVSLLLMAIGSACSARAGSVTEVAAFRLFAGLGFGGAVPTVLALVSEFAVPKWRSVMIAAAFNGFPLGGMLGSIVGAHFLPIHGWRAFFMLGAALPTLLLILVLIFLPESLQFRARVKARRSLANGQAVPTAARQEETAKTGFLPMLAQIFEGDLRRATTLVWLASFLSVLSLYCTVNFLPTLMSEAGRPMKTAILSIAALNVGSVVGSIILARLADRTSPYLPTAIFYVLGGLTFVLIATPIYSSSAVLSLAFVAGMLAFGAQLSLTAITTRLYPVAMKSTGIGFAHGVGRIGGAVGPFAAGLLLDLGASFGVFMAAIATMFALAGAVVLLLKVTAPVAREVVAA